MKRRALLGLLPGVPLLAGCSATGLLNLLAPSAHRREAGIAYGPHPRMKLDVYRPLDTSGPAPVVVFFYGGSWNAGRREDYLFVGAALAECGIVTVIPDYRLYPEVVYPAFLDDCAAAVAWTMDNAAVHGADADRLHVAGHSAGAYNAAMLALDARWLGKLGRRTDRLAGPYDFLPIANPDVKPVFNRPGVEDPAPADSQPLRHVSAVAQRSLLIAARDDELVNPQRNTGGLAQALRDSGVAVDERYDDGVNHLTLVGAFGRRSPMTWRPSSGRGWRSR